MTFKDSNDRENFSDTVKLSEIKKNKKNVIVNLQRVAKNSQPDQ